MNEARHKELQIWHQCQENEAHALEELRKRNCSPKAIDPPAFDREEKPADAPSQPPSVPDRSTKPFSFMHDFDESHDGLRTLVVPETLMPSFLSVAEPNTTVNIETCGILAGRMVKKALRITHLIIPKQSGTPDSCTTEGEEDQIAILDEHNLITLGWVSRQFKQSKGLKNTDLLTQKTSIKLNKEINHYLKQFDEKN